VMGWACSTYGGEVPTIFLCENLVKKTTLKTLA